MSVQESKESSSRGSFVGGGELRNVSLQALKDVLRDAVEADAFLLLRARCTPDAEDLTCYCEPLGDDAMSQVAARHINDVIAGAMTPMIAFATAAPRHREHFHDASDACADLGVTTRLPTLVRAGLRESTRLVIARDGVLFGAVLLLRNRPFGRADFAGLDPVVATCHDVVATAELAECLQHENGELLMAEGRLTHASKAGGAWLMHEEVAEALRELSPPTRDGAFHPGDLTSGEGPSSGAPGGLFAPLDFGGGAEDEEHTPTRFGLMRGRAIADVVELDRDNDTSLLVTIQAAGPVVERIRLTPRQRDLAAVLMRGLTLPAAADELGVSVETVREHVKILHTRLGVKRRVELVAALRKLVGERPAN